MQSNEATTDRIDEGKFMPILNSQFLPGNQTLTIENKSKPTGLTVLVIIITTVIAVLVCIFIIK